MQFCPFSYQGRLIRKNHLQAMILQEHRGVLSWMVSGNKTAQKVISVQETGMATVHLGMENISPWKTKPVVILAILFMVSVCGGRDLRDNNNNNVKIHDYQYGIYNRTLAKTLVQYASAVYMDDLSALLSWTCSRCSDLTKGFQIIEVIVDVQHCLQAFVGIADDLNAIVIAFRGTQEKSMQNWVEDLFCKTLDLNYPDMPGAMVHYGFYSAYHNTSLRPNVVEAVQEAQEIRGNLSIMVTGHSMGGAMAAFCALDLVVNFGAKNVEVVTFGQPRIGNSVFASYYSNLVPKTIRVTHEHDIVPHLPPYYTFFPQRTYHHFPREVWLYDIVVGSFRYEVDKVCDDSGEDPTCSRSVKGNSILDHLKYYGVELQASSAFACGIPWLAKNDTEIGSSRPSNELSIELKIDGDLFLPQANGGELQ